MLTTLFLAAAMVVPGRYPQGSTGALNEARLSEVPPGDWKLLVNEIYARHGHPFRKPEVAGYFAGQSWYHVSASPTPFSPAEQQNIDLVARILREGYSGSLAALARFKLDLAQQKPATIRAWLAPSLNQASPNLELLIDNKLFSGPYIRKQLAHPSPIFVENSEISKGVCVVFALPLEPADPKLDGPPTYVYYLSKLFTKDAPAGRWYLVHMMAAG